MKKFLITILIAAGLIGATYLVKPKTTVAPGTQTQAEQPVMTADYVKYRGQDGKTAFELLTAAAAVEFKSYDFGVFVESINGAKPDSKHFWKLYINGQESQVGADQAQTKNGDVIEWRLEEIK